MLKEIIEEQEINEVLDLGLDNFDYEEVYGPKMREILKSILPEETFNIIINEYYFRRAFIYKQGKYDYLVMFIAKDGFVEIHFLNMTLKELDRKLGTLKSSLMIFSFIFNVIWYYFKKKSYNYLILTQTLKD